MDLTFRRGRRADFAMLWAATFETGWKGLPEAERRDLDRARYDAYLREHIEGVLKTTDLLVAEASGEPVGYILLGEAHSMLSPQPFAFVYDIWVAPHMRRKGVGRALLEVAEGWARRRDLRRLRLEVAANNEAARALYAALDFEEERVALGKSL